MSKNLCLIDRYISHYIALGSTFIPCPKSYNQTRLGLKFQIKRKPNIKRILITKENVKLPTPHNRSGHHHESIGNFRTFLQSHWQITRPQSSANTGIGHRHEYITTSGLGHIRLFPIGSHLYRQLPYRLVTTATSADLHLINSRCVSKDTCPKTVSTHALQFRSIKSLMLQNSVQ